VQNASSAGSSKPPELVHKGGVNLGDLVLSQARTITALGDQVSSLKHQLAWFQRQVFGRKSERFAPEPDPTQMHLGEAFPVPDVVPETRKAVPAHTRRVSKTDLANTGEAVLRLDPRREKDVAELPVTDKRRIPRVSSTPVWPPACST
jgi:hypothetical protein